MVDGCFKEDNKLLRLNLSNDFRAEIISRGGRKKARSEGGE